MGPLVFGNSQCPPKVRLHKEGKYSYFRGIVRDFGIEGVVGEPMILEPLREIDTRATGSLEVTLDPTSLYIEPICSPYIYPYTPK